MSCLCPFMSLGLTVMRYVLVLVIRPQCRCVGSTYHRFHVDLCPFDEPLRGSSWKIEVCGHHPGPVRLS